MFLKSKKTVLFLNIFIIPVLSIIFYSYTTILVPKFIFELNNGWSEEVFRIACFSILINIIYALMLVFKEKEKLRTAIMYSFTGFLISITLGYFASLVIVMSAYIIFGGI